jgi:hypothetical protein
MIEVMKERMKHDGYDDFGSLKVYVRRLEVNAMVMVMLMLMMPI